jgi:hypothetical protein
MRIAEEHEIIYPLQDRFNTTRVEYCHYCVSHSTEYSRTAQAPKAAHMVNANRPIFEEDTQKRPILWGKGDAAECSINVKDCSLGTRRCTGHQAVAVMK